MREACLTEITASRTKFGAGDQGGVLAVARGSTVAVLICDKVEIHYHVQIFQLILLGFEFEFGADLCG